jgi:hypothetical protein
MRVTTKITDGVPPRQFGAGQQGVQAEIVHGQVGHPDLLSSSSSFEQNPGRSRRRRVTGNIVPSGQNAVMASYSVNPDAVARARQLIDSRQIVLDSDWGEAQPGAAEQNAFLESHSWEEYAQWHLGLTEGASDHTKARYAFVYGDFRRVHRMGIIACQYRAAEWRHKEIELAAHELLQRLDNRHS